MSLFDDSDYEVCQKCGGSGRIWDPKLGGYRMCDHLAEQLPPPDVNPDGPAGIESQSDVIRLNKQQARVWEIMRDGEWYTLGEIHRRTGDPEPSISARFRDLRKDKYGGHEVEREHLGSGLFRYRLIVNPGARMSWNR